MTQAADDFALIKQALETLQNLYPIKDGEPDAVNAFNRLLKPRPLRELVKEGYRAAWLIFNVKQRHFLALDEYIFWQEGNPCNNFDRMAIPILTPQDMGIVP